MDSIPDSCYYGQNLCCSRLQQHKKDAVNFPKEKTLRKTWTDQVKETSGIQQTISTVASSPGQIFSLTKRTNENGSAKKGPGIIIADRQ